ncbi:MAG: hypothetical protein K2K57_11635 [Oscillospiraceae bacterium]|nr:hypothetical protein [Oscillospiraceae bacterium]
MSSAGFYKLMKSEDFSRMIYPLSDDRRTNLRKSILSDGFKSAFKVWNSILLGDYEAYDICRENNIPFFVQNIICTSIEEAYVWVCKDQLRRSDLPAEMKWYLIGQMSLSERISAFNYRAFHEEKNRSFENTAAGIRMRIAKDFSVSQASVQGYEMYAEAIDIIRSVSEEFALNILGSKVKISQKNVIAISKMPHEEIKKIKDENYNIMYVKLHGSDNNKNCPRNFYIKQMPVYDPDAEVSSLTLTIPSWLGMITKVYINTDFDSISIEARYKLNKELCCLRDIAAEIIAKIGEV